MQIEPVEGHALRYIDWPRDLSPADSARWTAAGKRHRWVCECGEMGEWLRNVPAASRNFDQHLLIVKGEWRASSKRRGVSVRQPTGGR